MTKEEPTIYRDQGCSIAPACLSCPLLQCKYDTPEIPPTKLRAIVQRATRIREMRRLNLSVEEAARRWKITTRTVYRMIQLEKINGLPETNQERNETSSQHSQ